MQCAGSIGFICAHIVSQKILPYSGLVPGTLSEDLNGWSEALTVGLAVWTAKTKALGGGGFLTI